MYIIFIISIIVNKRFSIYVPTNFGGCCLNINGECEISLQVGWLGHFEFSPSIIGCHCQPAICDHAINMSFRVKSHGDLFNTGLRVGAQMPSKPRSIDKEVNTNSE